MKPVKISITLDDQDEAEDFLRGLIVARSNNSSEYFVELIEGVNAALESARRERLEASMKARSDAGMP